MNIYKIEWRDKQVILPMLDCSVLVTQIYQMEHLYPVITIPSSIHLLH